MKLGLRRTLVLWVTWIINRKFICGFTASFRFTI